MSSPISEADLTVDTAAVQQAAGAMYQHLQRSTPARPASPYSVDQWLNRRLEQFHEAERRMEAHEQRLQRLHEALAQVVKGLQNQVHQAYSARQSLEQLTEQARQWAQTAGPKAQEQLQQTQTRFEEYLVVLADADQALSRRVLALKNEAAAMLDPIAQEMRSVGQSISDQRKQQVEREIEQSFSELEQQLISRLQDQLDAAQTRVAELEQRVAQIAPPQPVN